jgi:hypothetical protein
MLPRVENIGQRVADHRRRGGWIMAVVALGAAIALFATDAPRSARLLLAVPVGLAAAGFLQAREKT